MFAFSIFACLHAGQAESWVDICSQSSGDHCCDADGGGMGDQNKRHTYWVMKTTGGSPPPLNITHTFSCRILGRLRSLLQDGERWSKVSRYVKWIDMNPPKISCIGNKKRK